MLTVFSDVQVFAVKKIQLIAISTEFIPQAIWKCYSQSATVLEEYFAK